MAKKHFIITQITQAEYFRKCEELGKPEHPMHYKRSIAGCMNIAPKTYLAYTSEDILEVPLEDEED